MAKAIRANKRSKKVQQELVEAAAPLAAASAVPESWSDDYTLSPGIPDGIDIDGQHNSPPITFWQAVKEMFGFNFRR